MEDYVKRGLAVLAALAVGTGLGLPVPSASAGEALNVKRTPMVERQDATAAAQFNLIKAVQRRLIEENYDPGSVDGLKGPRTTAALKIYQSEHNLVPDGVLGPQTLSSLGLQ